MPNAHRALCQHCTKSPIPVILGVDLARDKDFASGSDTGGVLHHDEGLEHFMLFRSAPPEPQYFM